MTPFLSPFAPGICEQDHTFAEIALPRCWRANGSQRHATFRVPLLSLQLCNERALPGNCRYWHIAARACMGNCVRFCGSRASALTTSARSLFWTQPWTQKARDEAERAGTRWDRGSAPFHSSRAIRYIRDCMVPRITAVPAFLNRGVAGSSPVDGRPATWRLHRSPTRAGQARQDHHALPLGARN